MKLLRIDKKKNYNNRRNNERLKIRMPCSFVINDERYGSGVTLNLAGSGIAIKTKMKVQTGDGIHILFKNCGEHYGHVVRTFPGGFGVALSSDSLAVIALSI